MHFLIGEFLSIFYVIIVGMFNGHINNKFHEMLIYVLVKNSGCLGHLKLCLG